MKKILLIALVQLLYIDVKAQDLKYARQIVDTLTSKTFWGRGYTKKGMHKASLFLENQFRTMGLQPMNGSNFLQNYEYPANTFPGKMQISINGKNLIPGKDFIVSPESKGVECKGKLVQQDSVSFIDFKNRVIFILKDKLTWSVAPSAEEYTGVELNKSIFPDILKEYSMNIENEEIKEFSANNVCAFVKGSQQPDSFVIFTAHYDHLGGMGNDTYFPGANDNASGVALLLNLANHYAKKPSRYSMAFILFAGEEAGLTGSKYFTQHPLIDLKKIRFLLNTDLAGTGEEGITIVNATIHPKEFDLMKKINNEKQFLKEIKPRGKAMNSDHYWFAESGVPAFFFYTLGGIKAYHDIYDISATLPLNEHEDLFKLLVEYCHELIN